MQLQTIDKDGFPIWKEMRRALYKGVDNIFHDDDMNWINAADEKAAFFIVTEENAIAGFIELSVRNVVDGCIGDRIGYLEGLYIKPDFRSRNLGRETVNKSLLWFKAQNCHEMATDTELENTPAQTFFAHIGFKETWRVVQFKKDLTAI